MIRSTFLGTTIRGFNTEEDAKRHAVTCKHPVNQLDELKATGGGWIYQSGEAWFDTDGMLPFNSKDLKPAFTKQPRN